MGTCSVMLLDHLAHATLTGNSPRTVRSRRFVLNHFIRASGTPLEHATRRDVERFLSRPLSPASRKTYLDHLRAFYRWALDQELLEHDPTAKVGTIRGPRRLSAGNPRARSASSPAPLAPSPTPSSNWPWKAPRRGCGRGCY